MAFAIIVGVALAVGGSVAFAASRTVSEEPRERNERLNAIPFGQK